MVALFAAISSCTVVMAHAEQLPASLRGTWRITRILPTTNSGCWTREQGQSLVGTTLTYGQSSMRWRGGVVSAEDFSNENAGSQPASFAQLGVTAAELVEVDMQHEDAAVLPASTEVP